MSIRRPRRFTRQHDRLLAPRYSALDGPGGVRSLVLDRKTQNYRSEKTTVYVRVIFLRLGEIDTAKELFTAEVLVQAKWREPRLDDRSEDEPLDVAMMEHYWNPKLSVDNVHGDPKQTIKYTLMKNMLGEALVCERRTIKATFIENLELREFPFDTQDLAVTLVSERKVDEVELKEDLDLCSTINLHAFIDAQEWKLFSYVRSTESEIGLVYEQSGRVHHPSITFECRATRRYGFFFWNVFFVMFFICSMTFTTFAVNCMRPENRLQLTFTLLLTTVAFRSNVNNSLPKISYLTYMDVYIILSMVLQCLVCAWHAVLAAAIGSTTDPQTGPMPAPPSSTAYSADKWVLVVFASLYIVANLGFILWVYIEVLLKRREYERYEREHKKRTKTINPAVLTLYPNHSMGLNSHNSRATSSYSNHAIELDPHDPRATQL